MSAIVQGGSFGVRADIHDGHLREGGRSGGHLGWERTSRGIICDEGGLSWGSFGMRADVQGGHLRAAQLSGVSTCVKTGFEICNS